MNYLTSTAVTRETVCLCDDTPQLVGGFFINFKHK